MEHISQKSLMVRFFSAICSHFKRSTALSSSPNHNASNPPIALSNWGDNRCAISGVSLFEGEMCYLMPIARWQSVQESSHSYVPLALPLLLPVQALRAESLIKSETYLASIGLSMVGWIGPLMRTLQSHSTEPEPISTLGGVSLNGFIDKTRKAIYSHPLYLSGPISEPERVLRIAINVQMELAHLETLIDACFNNPTSMRLSSRGIAYAADSTLEFILIKQDVYERTVLERATPLETSPEVCLSEDSELLKELSASMPFRIVYAQLRAKLLSYPLIKAKSSKTAFAVNMSQATQHLIELMR